MWVSTLRILFSSYFLDCLTAVLTRAVGWHAFASAIDMRSLLPFKCPAFRDCSAPLHVLKVLCFVLNCMRLSLFCSMLTYSGGFGGSSSVLPSCLELVSLVLARPYQFLLCFLSHCYSQRQGLGKSLSSTLEDWKTILCTAIS